MIRGVQTRQINLDVLRSLAMLMVVIWHFFYYAIEAHYFPTSTLGFVNYALSEIIVIGSNVCVNIFILLASYFLLDRPFNTKRILLLWFQVVFYSIGFCLLGSVTFAKGLAFGDILHAVFPVTNNTYWFFTDYIGLVILAPFLSKTASALSKKSYLYLLFALLILCCTFSLVIPLGNTMGAAKGYSLLWFIALFFWGAYYRKFGASLSKQRYLLFYLITVVFVFLFCAGKAMYRYLSTGSAPELEFLAYNGLAFPLAILLFLVFLKSTGTSSFLSSILSKVSPYSFGVYLITEHFLIRPILWETGIQWPVFLNSPWLIPLSLTFCIIVFFTCIGIDWVRAQLFKLSQLPMFCEKCSQWLSTKIDLLFSHL